MSLSVNPPFTRLAAVNVAEPSDALLCDVIDKPASVVALDIAIDWLAPI